MQISQSGLNQIKKHEGLRLKAYYDAIGKPTIGYGNTFFENGRPVRMGDVITMERAESLLRFTVDTIFSKGVDKLVKSDINQNQFDAMVSLTYNIGVAAFGGSTLLRRVNADPNDPEIANQFARWNRASGKILPGLTRRRAEEAELYFKSVEV